ncbi:MAG: LLM class flavin-dependent oxidoreductase [Actinomycetota bacterium]|nr:LLM class flavin-dependent oxidoreductase [Actinomycetota bacterium]
MTRLALQLHGNLEPERYGELAARAEQYGLVDCTVHDLLFRRPVWPLLCDVARATTRVAVGPNVTHPHLVHPVVTATNVAHLDDVSGGRAVLGIGRGSFYDTVGLAPPGGLAAVEEAVEVIGRVLAHDTGGWDGRWFRLAPGHALLTGEPRSVPVFLGCHGPKAVALAGRRGWGVRMAAQWDPAYPLEMREVMRRAAADAGRDPDGVRFVVETWPSLHPDREKARAYARRLLANFLPRLGPLLGFYGIAEAEVEAARAASAGDERALDAITDATIDRFMAAGDREDLARGLGALADAGFDEVSFSGQLGPDIDTALDMIGAAARPR